MAEVTYGLTQKTRVDLKEAGGFPTHLSTQEIQKVLERVGGDVEFAVIAILLCPRPQWMLEIIPDPFRGVLPRNRQEWGEAAA